MKSDFLFIFRKSVAKIQVSFISDNNSAYFTRRPIYSFDHISLNSSYNDKCFRQRCTENQTHILFSVTLSRKSCLLWDNVEKYCRAGQATDDSMAHAHCKL